jgi:hypothetical protein
MDTRVLDVMNVKAIDQVCCRRVERALISVSDDVATCMNM